MVERTLGFLLERARVSKSPAIELNGVDGEHAAIDAAPQCREDSHPCLGPSGKRSRLSAYSGMNTQS